MYILCASRYILKFSKGGKASTANLHADDLGLVNLDAVEGGVEGYLVKPAGAAVEGSAGHVEGSPGPSHS